MSIDEFLEEWNNPSPYVHVQTSGSTGVPKPMLVEKSCMLASACRTNDFLGLQPGNTALLCMSLDYIAGKMMVVRAIERNLKLISVPPSGHPLQTSGDGSFLFDPLSAETVKQKRTVPKCLDVCFVAMVPLQVYNSLQVSEERERLRKIRHLIIGGGAIDDELANELKDFPNAVWSSYGMTETLSHIALRRLNGPDASDWYTPFPSVRVSLSSEGCLVINDPDVCSESLVTNDIAELSSQGFRILGRKDNIICSGGLKIQAEQLERQLRQFLRVPYIITKRPDGKFGEIVVLLTEGSVDEAREICERIFPKFHQPRAYFHVSHIPLTATGKPARHEAERLALSLRIS